MAGMVGRGAPSLTQAQFDAGDVSKFKYAGPKEATAADLEALIESLRKDVLTKTGVELHWEIRRLGDRG